VAGDASDDDQATARLPELRERRVDGPQDAEHVGLELATVVREDQALERADDAEPGVGGRNVDPAEALPRRRDRALEVAVDRDVARDGNGGSPAASQLRGEPFQAVDASRGKDERRAPTGELPREGRADPRRRPGDQRDLASKWCPRQRSIR
jgi:hypothetical protein